MTPGPGERHVRIYEVGPRDGLQNEAVAVPTDVKVRFIELLVDAGLREIEATSFVSPRAIPQLADADDLVAHLPRRPGVRYPVLVPNERGMARARSGRRRRDRRLHGRDRRVHAAQHRHDRRRIARRVRARAGACQGARLVATRVRLDGVRMPIHRSSRSSGRGRRGGPTGRARRRRDLFRRHHRCGRPGPGRGGRGFGARRRGSR